MNDIPLARRGWKRGEWLKQQSHRLQIPLVAKWELENLFDVKTLGVRMYKREIVSYEEVVRLLNKYGFSAYVYSACIESMRGVNPLVFVWPLGIAPMKGKDFLPWFYEMSKKRTSWI